MHFFVIFLFFAPENGILPRSDALIRGENGILHSRRSALVKVSEYAAVARSCNRCRIV